MAKDSSNGVVVPFNARFLREMPRLKRRLAYRTDSMETAEDLLHEVWLRFRGRSSADIRSPGAYLSRIADNLAADEARRQARRLQASEVNDLLDLRDDAPTAEQSIIARDEIRAVVAAISELPERQRAIFIAARLRGERYASIAARHSITTRTVENEVRRVLDHCAARLDRLPR